MTNETLTLVAIAFCAMSGILAVLLGARTRVGDAVASCAMVAGSACGLLGAFRALAGTITGPLARPWSVPGGEFRVDVDALSAMFLAQIFLIGGLGSVYGVGYWSAPKNPHTVGKLRAFSDSRANGKKACRTNAPHSHLVL